ncbi:MAG: NAD(P)H-hydrate dehydratase [Candidatus Baltobacteraceae bacterium]
MRALSAEQMRSADTAGHARAGEVELMRRAGVALAEAVRALAPKARRLVAFAGPGNNGGDAFAAFAELDRRTDRIVYTVSPRQASAARRDAEARALLTGVMVRPFPQTPEAARAALEGADIALDAMLGTGARADPDRTFIVGIDALDACPAPVLAVDIPTGVDATSGGVAARAVRAGTTVTLGALKAGLLLYPARAYVGRLFVGDLGLDDEIAALPAPFYDALTDGEFLALLPGRSETADKRASGAPLIVAGSTQFPGAAVLCARGAARAGAGYVTVATGQPAAATLRHHLIEQVVTAWDPGDVDGAVASLLETARHCSAVALGPGLGLDDATGAILRGFIAKLELPFVADASAFFHLTKQLELLRGKRCVLTPHEREFARLSGEGGIADGTRFERLRAFVARTGVTTLLKGAATLVDDGAVTHVNPTGTNALATAGTGDVLTGIIATLLSQGLTPADAARAGAYWHGLAGRQAAQRRARGVVAGDVADALGEALPAPLQPNRLVPIR